MRRLMENADCEMGNAEFRTPHSELRTSLSSLGLVMLASRRGTSVVSKPKADRNVQMLGNKHARAISC
jgi:hypothetical protein